MPKLLREPRLWLLAQMLALVAAAGACGRLTPRQADDTQSYIHATKLPPGEMLGYHRTVGYPLLMTAVAMVSPDYRLMPWVHLGLFFLAALVLDHGLRRFGASPWHAFAVSTGFLWMGVQSNEFSYLLTDFPGMVMAVMAVGFLFSVLAAPSRPWPWVGLTLALAASYHLRPAYVFLVPLAPLLAAVLLRFRGQGTGKSVGRKWLPLAVGAASVSPYRVFCLVRLALLGDFGLVSFGGRSAVGIAVELVDRPMADRELSPRWRPLALGILEELQRRGRRSVFKGGVAVSMREYEQNFNDNAVRVGLPVASRLYGTSDLVLNEELSAFSREVIGLRKGKYLLLVAYGLPRAVARLVRCSRVVQLLGGAAALLFGLRAVLARRGRPSALRSRDAAVLRAVAWTAVLFFLAKAFLVVLVNKPSARYVLPAGVLVPSAAVLLIVDQARLLLGAGLTCWWPRPRRNASDPCGTATT